MDAKKEFSRTVGRRQERPLSEKASAEQLIEGALFSEAIADIARLSYFPKGVYRYKNHEEANKHDQDCLVTAMARLRNQRQGGVK